MKIASILAALLMILAGGAAADPIDPDPNGVGIFFDEGAETWCFDDRGRIDLVLYGWEESG